MSVVPINRIRVLNEDSSRPNAEFVLYWMIAFRRPNWNFALQRAVELAQQFRKPLVILEALRSDYRWANDRIHQFVIEGMIDNERAFRDTPVLYYPYLESAPREGNGLLGALSKRSAAIVTDDFPCFFLPRMISSVARRAGVSMEAVDSNGVYPMRDTDRVFSRAHYFRRHLQKTILPFLDEMPAADPLEGVRLAKAKPLGAAITRRWPKAKLAKWTTESLASLPIDHSVKPSPVLPGGASAAKARMDAFIDSKLPDYGDRNQPERDVATGLSPYLHFGHISSHEIVEAVFQRESWSPEKLRPKPNGSANGWWGMSEPAEGFLDELITWRELGYNMSLLVDNYDQYDSLPDWAQLTLQEHENDKRDYLYSLEDFESAQTHDRLWNAAQNQLVTEGRMHNYLRMLWGKKILEWTPNARKALDVMVELNNKYALDGRNPNSYSGIFWVLGRYDRAWGPERPVFGKIRFMSSDNTARKVRVKNYIQQYAGDTQRTLL